MSDEWPGTHMKPITAERGVSVYIGRLVCGSVGSSAREVPSVMEHLIKLPLKDLLVG